MTSYRIYRSTSPSPGSETLYTTLGPSVTSFTDTQVQSGRTYYYRVSAINSYGESPLSTEVKAVPPPTGKSWLIVNTAILSENDQANGYGITLSQNGAVVARQYSPANFTINDGQSYTVTVGAVNNFLFSHWGDKGTTQDYNPRALETDTSLILTAFLEDANGPLSITNIPGDPWGVAVNPLVSVDEKGRLVLPKKVRTEAHIGVQSKLVARATGIGRVELFDPDVLAADAQKIGAKKLAGWKEEDHEVIRYILESMKER